jgi:hypothetical protein
MVADSWTWRAVHEAMHHLPHVDALLHVLSRDAVKRLEAKVLSVAPDRVPDLKSHPDG